MPTKAERSEATRAALVGAAEALFAERGFADTPTEALAHILLGGLNEGAMLMASSPDPDAARQRTGEALRVVIDGLAQQPPR